MHELRSKLYSARKGTDSLKTTIPKKVVSILALEPGDVVEWILADKMAVVHPLGPSASPEAWLDLIATMKAIYKTVAKEAKS